MGAATTFLHDAVRCDLEAIGKPFGGHLETAWKSFGNAKNVVPWLNMNLTQPLTEKYRPRKICDFLGLEKVKNILTKFAAHPYPSAWLFVGPPGIGKTSMAKVLAEELQHGAQVTLISSQECTIDKVRAVVQQCQYAPIFKILESGDGGAWHFILVDEADEMTNPAYLRFLSVLDTTEFPPRGIFIFTCNSAEKLEPRFRSRCRTLNFSSHGLRQEIANFLADIWAREAPQAAPLNFEQLAKDSKNNVRDALMKLELELLES